MLVLPITSLASISFTDPPVIGAVAVVLLVPITVVAVKVSRRRHADFRGASRERSDRELSSESRELRSESLRKDFDFDDYIAAWREPHLEPSPRYLNIVIAKESPHVVFVEEPLLPEHEYLMLIDIALRDPESIVIEPPELDVSRLVPESSTGYWFDVVVASGDVDVEPHIHRLFLPFAGPSWVCECAGPEHSCTPNQRQSYLYVPFRTRVEIGNALLRCTVYHRNNAVQSARVELSIGVGAGHRAIVDYKLSSDFAEPDALRERELNIVTNEAAPGSHTLVIKGDKTIVAVDLTESAVHDVLEQLRAQLERITLGTDGESPQYDDDNSKSTNAFIKDLKLLANLGSVFWQQTVPRGEDRDALREPLRKRATIQISRVSQVVFPWALVYDIPHLLFNEWKLCPLLAAWEDKHGDLTSYPEACPYATEHGLDTLCPYGFWGFRHLIEQPPSVRVGELRTTIPVSGGARAAIVLSLKLDPKLTQAHVEKLHGCLHSRFKLDDCDSGAALLAAIADPALPIVYFYCHGRTAVVSDTDLELPYLQIGMTDKVVPGDFGAWADAGYWNRGNWVDVPPLIFINGCQTAGLSPESIVDFVSALANMDAAGVVGTEISVAQPVASEVAFRFYSYFAGSTREKVGMALYRTRIDLLGKGNISGLVYTPFCSMDLALVDQAA